jgi:hypothetical protein
MQDPTISGRHRSGEGRDRPRGYSAAEKFDELAPIWFESHLIHHEAGPRTAGYRIGSDQSAGIAMGV